VEIIGEGIAPGEEKVTGESRTVVGKVILLDFNGTFVIFLVISSAEVETFSTVAAFDVDTLEFVSFFDISSLLSFSMSDLFLSLELLDVSLTCSGCCFEVVFLFVFLPLFGTS